MLAKSKGINFVFVYIAEAHAMNEWPLRSSRYVPKDSLIEGNCAIIEKQHTSIEERSEACQKFKDVYNDKLPNEMYLDPIDGDFSKILKPWPARFYIMKMNDKMLILKYAALVNEGVLSYDTIESMIKGIDFL